MAGFDLHNETENFSFLDPTVTAAYVEPRTISESLRKAMRKKMVLGVKKTCSQCTNEFNWLSG